jgi:hypothetical protein
MTFDTCSTQQQTGTPHPVLETFSIQNSRVKDFFAECPQQSRKHSGSSKLRHIISLLDNIVNVQSLAYRS